MSLSIGIIGLPNVGKSTLFNALTNQAALAANYPFATIEPNTGMVPVPDARLDKLAKLVGTEKIVPAQVKFVDIAGLVEGAAGGEGLGNKFLAHIREVDAVCELVRAFIDSDVTHVADKIDPVADMAIVNAELMLADLEVVERQLPKITKEAKSNPKLRQKKEALESIKKELSGGQIPSFEHMNNYLIDEFKLLNLLISKPKIVAFNVSEQQLQSKSEQDQLRQLAKPYPTIFVNARFEAEINQLEIDERQEMLETTGVAESGIIQLIHAAYHSLNLISFLTAGPKEVRAWTIKNGSTAPAAAGVIHGDFERGFIAADVVGFADFVTYGSWASARSAGKVRSEGKDYIIKEGDLVEFKFNV